MVPSSSNSVSSITVNKIGHPISSSPTIPPPQIQTTQNNKPKNIISFKPTSLTSSISLHARNGDLSSAVSALSLIRNPNHITFLTLLSSCSDFSLGISLHSQIIKRFPLHLPDHIALQLNTALICFYFKFSLSPNARKLFDVMPVKNAFTFNSMIGGHMKCGEVLEALSTFNSMDLASQDKFSWTAVIDGFVKNGFFQEGLYLFQEMQSLHCQIEPDYVTIIPLVSACAGLGALGLGTWLHKFAMQRELLGNIKLANSFIDMYSRCGRVDLARQMFDTIDIGKRTRVTWNSMVVGYAINGRCNEALDCFDTMQKMGVEPDGVSFTGALTACSHAGLVDEGMMYYEIIKKKYRNGMRIEHYGCIVDLLGRAGKLEEAMRVVESMKRVMGANEVVLGSLMAACRMHENVGLAEDLMGHLVELEPDVDSNFVLLSNIYASVGKWDGAGKVRNAMKEKGIKKNPGFSAVEIDGRLYEFTSGDRGSMLLNGIHDTIELLDGEMKMDYDDGSNLDMFINGSSDRKCW